MKFTNTENNLSYSVFYKLVRFLSMFYMQYCKENCIVSSNHHSICVTMSVVASWSSFHQSLPLFLSSFFYSCVFFTLLSLCACVISSQAGRLTSLRWSLCRAAWRFLRVPDENQECRDKEDWTAYRNLRVPYLKWLSCKRAFNFIINLCYNVRSALKRTLCHRLMFMWVNYVPYHMCKVSLNRKTSICIVNRGES